MNLPLVTIGFFLLFGGWAFLSLLGAERTRRLNELEAERVAAKPSAPAAPPAPGAADHSHKI